MKKLIIFLIVGLFTINAFAQDEPDHVFKCNLLVESNNDGNDSYYESELSMLVFGDSAMLKVGNSDWLSGTYSWNIASSETPVYTGSVWNVIHYNKLGNGVELYTTYAFDTVSFPSMAFYEDGSSVKVETVKLSIIETNLNKRLITGAETMLLGECGYFYK